MFTDRCSSAVGPWRLFAPHHSSPKESLHEYHPKPGRLVWRRYLSAMNQPRRMKIALAVAAGLIAVPAVALVVLLNVDWNRAKPWFNARTSEALGRPFSIAGDLSLTWEKPAGPDDSWRSMIPWPHLVAQDIHIGNPPAMTASSEAKAEMAHIRAFAFSLNPLALLEKRSRSPSCVSMRPSSACCAAPMARTTGLSKAMTRPRPGGWNCNVSSSPKAACT